MTADQINLVKISFGKIQPVVEEAAVLFYARLFELDPSLRALFHTDIREQGHKLMQILGVAVEGLDRIGELQPTLEDLGARHIHYGVKDAHYDTVGEALLWTLRKALKSDYTEKIHDAWTETFAFIATTMKSGANKSRSSAAR